jgi:hypothetical protein
MLCIVIIAISAGSRVLVRVFRARKTRIPRAQSLFFVSLSREMFGSTVCFFRDIFLCNHKHIQSFVNSVLIIAKTLSLSPSLARAFIIEASAKEREKERKRKRDTILIFFSCEEKKGVHEKKKERKKTKRDRENPDTKDDTKSSSLVLFLFLFRYFNEEEHHLEKTTEKRSIKKGSER